MMTKENGSKLRMYRLFKTNFEYESYLDKISNENVRRNLLRLRISAQNLKIETGRHHRPRKIPLNERVCNRELS